jgi:hypothetical protein
MVIQCRCMFKGSAVTASSWALTSGSQYATVNQNGKIKVNPGVQDKQITVQCAYGGKNASKTITVTYIVLAQPVITCSSNVISMTCPTSGADIYYRIGRSGSFVKYMAPFEISEDVVVQAYSKLATKQSEVVTEEFEYEGGGEDAPAAPVVTCDGQNVRITCETPGAGIYYRMGTSGGFSLYEGPIGISQTTTIQAYSEINGKQSTTIS